MSTLFRPPLSSSLTNNNIAAASVAATAAGINH